MLFTASCAQSHDLFTNFERDLNLCHYVLTILILIIPVIIIVKLRHYHMSNC